MFLRVCVCFLFAAAGWYPCFSSLYSSGFLALLVPPGFCRQGFFLAEVLSRPEVWDLSWLRGQGCPPQLGKLPTTSYRGGPGNGSRRALPVSFRDPCYLLGLVSVFAPSSCCWCFPPLPLAPCASPPCCRVYFINRRQRFISDFPRKGRPHMWVRK